MSPHRPPRHRPDPLALAAVLAAAALVASGCGPGQFGGGASGGVSSGGVRGKADTGGVPDELRDLAASVRDFAWRLQPPMTTRRGGCKPLVVLMHGMYGAASHWRDVYSADLAPFDLARAPATVDLGLHDAPPRGIPALKLALSPTVRPNTRGIDRSDSRSAWHALARAGYSLMTYTQTPSSTLLPFNRGAVAELERFMRILQRDVIAGSERERCGVAIVAHSRGGLISRAVLGGDAGDDLGGDYPDVRALVTISSPHRGTRLARLNVKLHQALDGLDTSFGSKIAGVTSKLRDLLAAWVAPQRSALELEPGSAMLRAIGPLPRGIRMMSIGGTSPRLTRLYRWVYHSSSRTRRSDGRYRWRARAVEIPGVSPLLGGGLLQALTLALPEAHVGTGDALTSSADCRFPVGVVAEHRRFGSNHAGVLRNGALLGLLTDWLAR